jgi:nitroreductase
MISGFTADQLRKMEPDLLRAIIREKAHHTVEYPLYRILFSGEKAPRRLGESLTNLLDIWRERNLPIDGEDIRWCQALLEIAEQVKAGRTLTMFDGSLEEFSPEDRSVVQRLLQTRRSIRIWRKDPVSRDLIEEVIRAGQWAPHSCNLQTLRFAVIEFEEEQAILKPGEIDGWRVCIFIGQDMRPYETFAASVPTYNQDLDCGAAVQNMLLCAHSLGLGAVWATFREGEAEEIHRKLHLPDHIRLRTYIALGHPAQSCLAPGRISLEEAILLWQQNGSVD